MAGKNQRSATLPSSLRHGIQQTEESEGFFTKLRKKFRLKKGRYHVDVNTGDCQNVAPVSFRKRESRELLDDESPWQLRDPKSEERELSPEMSKQSLGKLTDKHPSGLKGKERKLSNPETYTRSLNSSEINSFQRSSFGAKPKSSNEYSPLTYDTKDNVTERSLKLRESALKNEFVIHDDSAIELDTDIEKVNKISSESDAANFDFGFDPGYEKLPEKRQARNENKTPEVLKTDFDPNYESVQEVRKKVQCESKFDPNYESVDEMKSRVTQKRDADECFQFEDDPGYQSVKDVKRETPERTTGELIRPAKTYSMNQSIESLDEPGYESLNDVKKRINEQNLDKSGNKTLAADHIGSETAEIWMSVSEGDEFNDSAIGSVPKSGCLPQSDLSRKRSLSGDGSIVTSDSNGGLRAFAETAVSLTGIATALTGSGTSKDSGFESKERSLDLEQEENLYSSVKKSGKGDSENPYSMVNKERKKTEGDQQVEIVQASGKTSATEPVSDPGLDDYDSDTGVMLDPGYAECADAIKGIIPYSVYSEGSGSKMSSCTSLDLSAEDFALEPGYAECADAIKSGAIKKISVSHERLVDHSVGTKHEDHKSKGEISSEIYANPQILFRKRSKLIEDGNLEDLNETNEKTNTNKDKSSSAEKEICLAVENKSKKKEKKSKNMKQEKEVPIEAPPLPARNYSLYLDNEEAEEVVQEVLQDCEKDENLDGLSLDDAFEVVESGTLLSGLEKSETVKCSDKAIETTKEQRAVIGEVQTELDLNCQGSLCCEVMQSESGNLSSVEIDTDQTNTNNVTGTYSANNADDTGTAHVTNKSERVTEVNKTLQERSLDNRYDLTSSEITQSSVSVNELEQPYTDKLGTGTCVTNFLQSDLTEKGDCNERIGSDNSVESNKYAQDLSVTANDEQLMDNCLHVNVKDESGHVKILKVVEKQESFKLQKKRENSKKGVGNYTEMDRVEHACKGAQFYNQCDELATQNDDNKDLPQTKDFRDSKSSPNSTKLHESKDNNCIVDQEPCVKGDVFSSGSQFTEQKPQLTQTLESCKDNIKGLVSGNINAYQSNTSSCSNGLSETDSSNFLTVAVKMKTISVDSDCDFFNTDDLPKLEINESDLESPFDSSDQSNNLDIETESAGINKLTQRLNAGDIPLVCSNQTKCKIDLETMKDESKDACVECVTNQTSKDETDGDTNSPDRNICRKDSTSNDEPEVNEGEIIGSENGAPQSSEMPSSTNELCVNKNNLIQNVHALNDTYQVQDEVFEDMCDSKTNDRKATLESRLCVIESEKDGESDLSKLMGSYSDGAVADTDNVDNELSDDSAIGNINDLQQNVDYLHSDINSVETCSRTGQDTSDTSQNKQIEINNSDNVSSQQLHLIYEKEHPTLYEDSEPTHMSLKEVMGLSPAHDHVTVFQSESSGQSSQSVVSPNTFVHTNIPNSDQEVTPPPRPPPVTSASQSRSKISVPCQLSEGPAVTPTDDVPPPVMLSYGSGQSDEESPPAVPPRLKSVKTTKRPERGSYSQDFMESMRQLKDCGWYWGPLSWEEAEHKLAKKPEGTFLVRDSSDEHYILSLSFKNQGRVHHTRIEHHKGHFSFWSQPDSHGKSTIKEFIEQCVENSRNGRFLYFIRPSGPGSPPMPIQLLHPVSRFVQMRSLQHMCRFRILQLVRRDHIDHLPVPTRIKQYLKEAQYYVEYLDD